MEYKSWNLRNIKKQIISCKHRGEDYTLPLEILTELLNDLVKPFETYDFMDCLEQDQRVLKEYAYFTDSIRDFSKLRQFEAIGPTHELNEFSIPNNEILTFTHDFFMNFNPEWKDTFKKVFLERKNNLKFSQERSYSVYIPQLDYSYLNIQKNNSVEDFFNCVHEYAHTIVDRLKYRFTYDSGYPFVELVPLFTELVIKRDLLLTYTGLEEDIKTYYLASLDMFLKHAKQLVKEIYYFNNMGEPSTESEVIKDIQSKLGVNNAYARELVHMSAIEKLCYVINILVAIELYYIYNSDPEKCFYILNKLIYLENSTNYLLELERLGVYVNDNSLKFIKEIKRS